MKASELIEALQEAIYEHGDLEVFSWPYDGQGGDFPATIEVAKSVNREPVIIIEG